MKKYLLMLMLLAGSISATDLNITGTTNTEDNHLDSSGADYNEGGREFLKFSLNDVIVIRCKNVAALLGANQQVDACTLYAYQSANDDDGTNVTRDMYAFRIFKPWVEGNLSTGNPTEGQGCTYNDWSADTYEWGTAGCANASDAGDDNNTDAGGYDRTATAFATVTIGYGLGGWKKIPMDALGQAWYDGTADENGIALTVQNNIATTMSISFHSSEYTTDEGLRPYFKFTYSPTGTVKKLLVKNKP